MRFQNGPEVGSDIVQNVPPDRTEYIKMGTEIQPKCARRVPAELGQIMLRKRRSGAAKCRAKYPI